MAQTVSNEDLASMVVTLSADLSKYQKEMSKVAGIAEKSMKGAEKAVESANDNISRSHKKAADDAIRANRAAGASAANMGAQFQDVAVQLQSGTSPLTVAVQQGQQLAAVLTQVKQQGGSLIGALGGAVGAFINPIAIATVALIAAAGYAVQYFSKLSTGSKQSEEDVRKHIKSLTDLANTYGSEVSPALTEYLNKLKDAEGAQERQAQLAAVLQKAGEDLGATWLKLAPAFTNAMDSILPKDTVDFVQEAQRAIEEIFADLEAGRNAGDLGSTIDTIVVGLRQLGDSNQVQDLIGSLITMKRELVNNEQNMKKVAEEKERFAKAGSADMVEFNKALEQMRSIAAPAILEAVKAMQAYDAAVKAAHGNQTLLNQAAAGLQQALGTLSANAMVQLTSTSSSLDDIVKVIAQIESGTKNLGVHDAAKGTASGLFGFVDKTWIATLKSMGGEFAKMNDQQLLALKGNADIQIAAAKQLTEVNQRLLVNAGQAVNDVNTVMSHWLGSGGALDVLRNVGKGTTGKEFLGTATIKAHPELGDLDAEGILALVQKKIDAAAKARGIKLKVDAELDTSSLDKALRSLQENTSELIAGAQAAGEYSAALDQKVFAEEKATKTQELMNIATRDGKTVTDEQKASIDAAATAWANAKGHAAAYTDEQKNTLVWQKALNEGLKDGAKEQKELAQTQQQVAQQYAQMGTQFISTFVSGLRQGKSATEALKDSLIQLADQLLSMALNKALTSLFTSIGVPALAAGGMVGGAAATRRVGPYAFVGAPRMATGGLVGVRPGEFPTLLHRGEMVIPAAMVRQAGRMGSGSSGGQSNTTIRVGNVAISTNIEGAGDVKADTQRGRNFGLQMKALITNEIQKQSRPGGILTAGGSGFRVGR